MTPEEEIADLDMMLEEDGEEVTLRRNTGTQKIPFDCKPRASVRGLQAEEIFPGSGLTQQSLKLIMSPTTINRTGWPGAQPAPAGTDKRIPRRNDVVLTTRGETAVESAAGIYMVNTLVRIEVLTKGQQQ